MKDIILIPTYNERENIKVIVSEIFNIFPEVKILVIDDSSPDGTAAAVKYLMEKYPNLSLLERRYKTGLGNAYKDAMSRVIKDKGIRSIITMDADGSHSAEYLRDFFIKNQDIDLIIGSRYVGGGGIENWERWRKELSRFGNLYVKLLTGLPINDFTAGFMCIKREFLEKLDLNKIGSSGYSFLIELKFYLIHEFNASVYESPIIFKSRREGESKLSRQIIKEGLRAPWRLFFKRVKKWKKK
ncbi:MAG: polyprenol monophosphomannose synthase [Patescibacteria group bacterium]|nr:polyprenol monophosphomannose synthase [Patescibacteria group bacterium]